MASGFRVGLRPLAVLLTACVAMPVAGVAAAEWGDALALAPLQWDFDGLELDLGGSVTAAAFTAHETGGPARPRRFYDGGIAGQGRASVRLERTLDNGLVLGARTNFLLFHDALSDDRYGDDTIEKAYVYIQSGYGTVELGQQDGAAEQLALTGPRLDPRVSLDDPDTSFFLDPATGKRFDRFLRPFAAAAASSVAAKVNYLSPRLFGLKIGLSYTPEYFKAPLPFVGNPTDIANRQDGIFEAAANYSTYLSRVALGGSLAYATGTLSHGTPGHADLSEWAAGAEIAYAVSGVRLSAGGGYRDSNAYGFATDQVYGDGRTRLFHFAFTAQDDPWSAGVEYSNAEMKGPATLAAYRMNAYQLGVSYRVNGNMDLTAGWQWYDYVRNLGLFANGRDRIGMNAGFFTANYAF